MLDRPSCSVQNKPRYPTVMTMTEPHKRANRHLKYKTAYRVKNWSAYDQALRDRGDITLWLSQEAIDAWIVPKTGNRGGQTVYSNIAIEAALTLRLIFHLSLRQTEGFLRSVLTLMDVALPWPDHTTLSRRNATVSIRKQAHYASPGPISLIVVSSGLKVCGQGEWHTQKHGEKKRKCWKKLHIGVDNQGWITASAMTDSHEQDPSQVPVLLAQVDREIDRVIGDGIYDQEPVYAAVVAHSSSASVSIPPRKDAVLSLRGTTSPTQRDRHLLEIERAGRLDCKRTSGYYDQAHAENAFSRYKRMVGGGLQVKRDESQERETLLGCALLN